MANTDVNISITASGASAATSALNQTADGLRRISNQHDQLAGRFQQRIQHIGLMMFARDAITANGLGREARMIIGMLNMALMQGTSAFGAAGAAVMPYVIGLGVLAGALATIISKHRENLETLEKNIRANNDISESYASSIKTIDDYLAAGGKTTRFLEEYKKAQEDAKVATDNSTIALEKQTLQAIQQNIEKIKDQIREQGNLNDMAKMTIATGGNVMAGTIALSNAYSQIGNDKLPTLNKQLVDANANLKQHQGAIESLKSGYTSYDKMLQASTQDLKDQAKASEEAKKKSEEAARKTEEAWKQSHEVMKQGISSMENSFNTAMAQMIVAGKNFTDTMDQAFINMGEDIIKMILKMIEEWAVFQALTGLGGMSAVRASAISGFIPAAEGFSGMVSKPTLFLAGEAGPEHVNITPSGGYSSSTDNSVGNVTVNVYGITDPRRIADEVGRQIATSIRGRGQVNFTRS
jgi:hypothetical protein